MDGFALRAEDAAVIGSKLKVIGESAAGRRFEGSVQPGEAVRIFTGAPMPDGADSVLLQEDAVRLAPDLIEAGFVVTRGRHVRPRGQDFTESEIILQQGDVLDAGRLTLAAAMNHREVTVYRRPLVVIIATGDELVAAGEQPGPDQIIASSVYGASALASEAGAEVEYLGIVADTVDAITAAVDHARELAPDIIVTLGGASVGDHDLVQQALTRAGMVLDFWKIAMRPGKPLMVGSLGDCRVLGLPGNPVSSLVCAILFLQPLIAQIGRTRLANRTETAISATALAPNDHRQDHLRATLLRRADGALVARSFGKQDSSQMKIFAAADCLIVRPPNAPAVPEGGTCEILLLRPPA
jgi:molybdopterin molybdotransferase